MRRFFSILMSIISAIIISPVAAYATDSSCFNTGYGDSEDVRNAEQEFFEVPDLSDYDVAYEYFCDSSQDIVFYDLNRDGMISMADYVLCTELTEKGILTIKDAENVENFLLTRKEPNLCIAHWYSEDELIGQDLDGLKEFLEYITEGWLISYKITPRSELRILMLYNDEVRCLTVKDMNMLAVSCTTVTCPEYEIELGVDENGVVSWFNQEYYEAPKIGTAAICYNMACQTPYEELEFAFDYINDSALPYWGNPANLRFYMNSANKPQLDFTINDELDVSLIFDEIIETDKPLEYADDLLVAKFFWNGKNYYIYNGDGLGYFLFRV